MIYYNKSYVNAHNSRSQNILPYKFNTFLILLKYLSHTAATALAIWAVTDFFFLLHSFLDRRLVPPVGLSHLSIWSFSLISLELSLKSRASWLLFGISELPALLLLGFGAKGYLTQALRCLDSQSDNGGSYWARNREDMLDKGMIHNWIGWARPHEISSQSQNMAQFTTSVLFISGTFHLIFSDCDWPWVTEISESKTRDEVGTAVSHISLMTALWGRDCYSHLTEGTVEARGG